MRKIVLIFILVCFVTRGFAQLNTNVETIFKMFLFLEKKNTHSNSIDIRISKNDSLYEIFSNIILFKLDTLKVIKNKLQDNLLIPEFNFYELLIFDNVKQTYTDNVNYRRKLTLNEEQLFGVPIGGCDSYVIAINEATGVGYRLKGFDLNDFLSFLSDFKEIYNKQNRKKLSNKDFLNLYKIEGLNFECLYEGLKARNTERRKYPCLKRASDVNSVR